MNDFQPFPCCDQNKTALAVVWRDYKRKAPKGFYTHCFQALSKEKWTPAKFCPFCGADFKKLSSFI